MFISLARPQVDMVLSGDNVFASGAAAAFAPWAFHLSQVNTARIFQQRLHEMSFNPVSLKGNWPEPGLKQQPQEHHGLPAYGRGFYPVPSQNTESQVQLLTGEEAPLTNNPTSRPPSYASHYSASTESRPGVCHSSSANMATSSQLLDSSYWQMVQGAAALSSFTPHGRDPVWDHTHQSINPSVLEYNSYTVGVHASVLPQHVFRPGGAFPTMTLASMPDKASADHGSTDSELYDSSDMLEAMVLSDEPSQTSWSASSPASPVDYDDDSCIDVTVHQTAAGSTWPGPSGDEKTVSPKMLRLRPTPSPASSCESIRTTFLAGTAEADEPLHCTGSGVGSSQAAKPDGLGGPVSKARKLLPASSQNSMSKRQSTARSNSPSHPSRKLSKLKPMPRLAPAPRLPSPPDSLQPSRTRLPAASMFGGIDNTEMGRIELADRCSKDDFLVKYKQAGLTYKEIRRMGGFTEAESTLRGRYRTLTKSREARVRKPEWSDKDLRLLEKGVRELAHTSDLNPAKVPWKKVAEYISANGGTYHFGNSTVRKRWDELVREQLALGKNMRLPFYEQSPGQGLGDEQEGCFLPSVYGRGA